VETTDKSKSRIHKMRENFQLRPCMQNHVKKYPTRIRLTTTNACREESGKISIITKGQCNSAIISNSMTHAIPRAELIKQSLLSTGPEHLLTLITLMR